MQPATHGQLIGPGQQDASKAGPAWQQITAIRGDTLRRQWTINDAEGNPLPMGGVEARIEVRDGARRLAGDWRSSAGPQQRITLADGLVSLDATDEDMRAADFKAGVRFSWSLILSNASGQRFTFVVGPFVVIEPAGAEWQP